MVERRQELDARYTRKKKMQKLKKKLLGGAAGADKEKILGKIRRISPFWTEASLTQGKPAAATEKPAEAPKKKAPPKKKPAAEKPA